MRTTTKELVTFGAVGVVNTTVDVATYTALVSLSVPTWLAIVVSTTLGLVCSYTLNRAYTFRAKSISTEQVVRFITVTLTGLWLLQPLIITSLQLFVDSSSLMTIVMLKLVATAGSMAWNFYLYRAFVFEPSSR